MVGIVHGYLFEEIPQSRLFARSTDQLLRVNPTKDDSSSRWLVWRMESTASGPQ